jgi:ABC-type sugar transport system ATPase subunit
MLCIGSLILMLALLILFHQNANATKGYMLRTLERERTQLLLEEEVLKMELAQEQSLAVLEQDNQIQLMLEPTAVLYTNEEATLAGIRAQ